MTDSLASTSVRPLTILTQNDGVPGSKFEREPKSYTVEQLKRWLKCRGLKQSGKRPDLLVRVSDCINAGKHHLLDVSIDAGKWFAAKVLRESTRLNNTNSASLIQQSVGIPVIPTSGWRSFQSQGIPDCSTKEIFIVMHWSPFKLLHMTSHKMATKMITVLGT